MALVKRKSRHPAEPKSAVGGPLIAFGGPLFGPSDEPKVRVLARDQNGKPTLQGVAYKIAGPDDD